MSITIYRGNIIYTQILSKYQNLDAQIQTLQQKISTLPKGKLCCATNGKYCKWYQQDNNASYYIPKSNRSLAVQLARKKYLHAMLKDLIHEKRALQFYLDHHSTSSKTLELLEHPEYQMLLQEELQPTCPDLYTWMHASYIRNPSHPEFLIHKSCSGNLLRSKSEAIIDMLLHVHQIPFRYECALSLGTTTIFPDFTIRHPQTGCLYYWEHFGQMDNPTYSQNTYAKLQLYTNHNILPTINLITTFETKETPLSSDVVEKIINLYFINS